MSATPVFTIPESFRTIACKHRELAAAYDTVAGLLESPNTGVPALKTDQVVKSVGEMATEVGLSVEPATEAPAKRGRKAKAEEAPAVAEPKPAPKPAAPTMTPGELAVACKTKFVALANRDPDQAAARKLLADFKVAKFSLLPADQHAAFFEAMKAAENTAAAPSIVE